MVKICPNDYPSQNEQQYSQYFDKYPFPLSSFQKFAIESIVEGNHILVTAHTGSGKTLPAEFSIEYFVSKGKKVIYTSPIKALSNQKFYEFTQKFPHISFGILTGDIKTNPEADVLIMTTEILMNTLYTKHRKIDNEFESKITSATMFEMDFDTELACVIFDEIHYINDPDRGRVWEETIMMLPQHIQMVMLSATLDSPEKFALWCETRQDTKEIEIEVNEKKNKIVYLTTTYERVVPLTHYSFITCTQGLFKVLKDKQLEKEIMKTTNTLHILQDAKGNFSDTNYQRVHKTLKIFQDKKHFVKRQHVLNTVARHMVDNNMLPAICFVLSRKTLEQCAKETTTDLLEDDSKVPYIVRKECEQIIRKLPNYQEYLNLPEYLSMVSLLEKGIAIHHAGIMPILREMVELLFAKGYIKLLFATETFAVGINMPTKTVLFTSLSKFDGTGMRPFYSHEYTQMAGRAGRRGIDTIGHVIHLTNLFKDVDQTTVKIMMKGEPQKLVSKFKISYNLLLNLIYIGETDYTKYAKRSMAQGDIEKTMKCYNVSISKLENEINNFTTVLNNCRTPINIVEEYIELKQKRLVCVNKKRKEAERSIQSIQDMYKNIDNDVEIVTNYTLKQKCLTDVKEQSYSTEKTIDTNVAKVLKLLQTDNFIECQDDNKYILTNKGHIATYIRETHCLVFAELIASNALQNFQAKELVGILSCFTNITVQEEKRDVIPTSEYLNVKNIIQTICNMYENQLAIENYNMIETGIDYSVQFDIIDYAIKWCECETDADCKLLVQNVFIEKEIFLGEFVKAILKINNIASEMEKIAELLGDMNFLSVLKQIPQLTLKYVATNQSLYV
jgi:superfamily II RNA helicase